MLQSLGAGYASKVCRGYDTCENQFVAVKLMDHPQPSPLAKRELKVLQYLRECIGKLEDVEERARVLRFVDGEQTPSRTIIVTELLTGLDFADIMELAGSQLPLPADCAHRLFVSLAKSLRHVHSWGVAHLDVKLDNVIVHTASRHIPDILEDIRGGAMVTLIDFGFAQRVVDCSCSNSTYLDFYTDSDSESDSDFEEEDSLVDCLSRDGPARSPKERYITSRSGTLSYVAPEVLSGHSYLGRPADVWSLGVVMYLLFAAHFPYTGRNHHEVYEAMIRNGRKRVCVSDEFEDLLDHMLCVDPSERYTIQDILSHPFSRLDPVTAFPDAH